MTQTTKRRATKLSLGLKSQPAEREIAVPETAAPVAGATDHLKVVQADTTPQAKPSCSDSTTKNKPKEKQYRDYRTIRPDIKERYLSNISRALGLDRIEELPLFFRQDRLMPAKIGLFSDLIQRFPEFKGRKALEFGLQPFFTDIAYRRSVIEEQQRYDLDLNPVEGVKGEITHEHKVDAQKHLNSKLQRIKSHQKKQKQGSEN